MDWCAVHKRYCVDTKSCISNAVAISNVVSGIATYLQPAPIGEGDIVVDMVMRDMQERKEFGTKKYGTPLRANNGRDPLLDAYQEALDLAIYLKQALMERDGKAI